MISPPSEKRPGGSTDTPAACKRNGRALSGKSTSPIGDSDALGWTAHAARPYLRSMALTPEEQAEAEALLRSKQAKDRLREKHAELSAARNALLVVGKAIDEELQNEAKTDLSLAVDGRFTNHPKGTTFVSGGPRPDRLLGPEELSGLLSEYRKALEEANRLA